MAVKKIVLIEDELDIQKTLKIFLESEGFTVITAGDGIEGLNKVKKERPDVVILDLMLPQQDGYTVCRQIREKGIDAFVIMLTAKKEEMDRIMGFNSGTDDYMVKPFSLMELLAKVKALFRRIKKDRQEEEVYHVGRLRINFKKYEALLDNVSLDFSTKEYEILRYFLTHPGEVVSRDNLLDTVWGYDVYPSTRTVDNFIMRIRQKLEKDHNKPEIIVSIRGVGYKFCPEGLN